MIDASVDKELLGHGQVTPRLRPHRGGLDVQGR